MPVSNDQTVQASGEVMVSPKKVALAIGVSEASLKRWCDKGVVPFVRTAGGHRRIPVSGVMQFLRESGQELARPELLSLPARTGRGDKALEGSIDPVRDALQRGDEEQFRRLIFTLYLARHAAAEICDRVITPAFEALGRGWHHGTVQIYEERRGCNLCLRTLFELAAMLPPVRRSAPRAIGATLSQDPYAIPTTMIEIALREAGWHARSYGTNLPAETICAALRNVRPRLLWLSMSHIDDPGQFLEEYPQVYEAASQQGAAVVVGGRALTEELRREMRYTTFCDNLQHLLAFVDSLTEGKRAE